MRGISYTNGAASGFFPLLEVQVAPTTGGSSTSPDDEPDDGTDDEALDEATDDEPDTDEPSGGSPSQTRLWILFGLLVLAAIASSLAFVFMRKKAKAAATTVAVNNLAEEAQAAKADAEQP